MADSPSVHHSGIQAIDKTSVHRICSGQVVLNLATAIKELVENSIDAGASSVEVRLKEYGKELVEVTDNGRGVKQENFAGLTLKHHTSKLKDFSDLVNVDTFGFRGEALSSLCALSKMSIVTCHESAEIGTKLEYDLQGKIVKQIPFPRQKGTTVSLQNIFYTLPVRHKEFIRNLKREFSKAIQVLNAYCIISTGVRITCTNQSGKGKKTTVVSTGENPTVIENITNIFGAKQAQTLLIFTQCSPEEDICKEFGISEQQMKKDIFYICGYISSSEHGLGRSSTDRQFYFINKRPCDHQKISRLVNDVYHMYNRYQYPFVVLDISLSKDSVDVNVTPDKRQVFVQEEKLLLAVLKSSLIKMFEPRSSLYKVNDGNTEKKSGKRGLDTWSFKKSPSKLQMSSPASENQIFGSLDRGLKRRFSSAYAKSTDEPNSSLEPKQRKLDSLVISKPASKETVNKDWKSSDCSTAEQSTGISAICKTSVINDDDSDLSSTSLPTSESINTSEFNSVIGLDATENVTLQTQGTRNACDEQQVDSCADMQVSSVTASTSAVNKPDYVIRKVYNANCEYDGDKSKGIKSSFSSNKLTNFARFSGNTTTSSSRRSLTKQPTSPSPVRKFLQQFLRKHATASEVLNSPVTTTYSDSNEEQPSGTPQYFVCHMDSVENDAVSSKETISVDCRRLTNSAEKKWIETNESLSVTYTEYDEAEELYRKERKIDFSMNKVKQSLENRQAKAEARRSHNFHAQIKPTDNQVAEDELKKEISKDMFSKMEILGQFNLGFIVTRLGRDLFIIDQHATDEKYNFEQLQKHTIIQSQKLIQPQRLELTAANECVLVDNLEIFHSNGFDFIIDEEAPPTQRVRLATMPISKNWTFGKEDIEELIFMLTDSPGVMCRPSRIRQMFASRACRKSIMIGTALNKAEMKKIVCRMGELDQPWNCPHGRPTMRHLINLDLLPD